jgi:hypothetical protein
MKEKGYVRLGAGFIVLGVIALVVYSSYRNRQKKSEPVSLGACSVISIGDDSGSTVSLKCKYGEYMYTTGKTHGVIAK